jgi:2,4-dienoyl-CoA reductase-like NADH-dependent reductase (Old Yellow Enzyme family)
MYGRAGLGVVFIGGVAVSPEGRSSDASLLLDRADKVIELTSTVHAIRTHGAVPILQLMHAGRQSRLPLQVGELLAPSAIPCPVIGRVPREMSKTDIATLISKFRVSAELARDAGVKVVELHAAHGYLISGFLSPYSNQRGDEYGGSNQNRFRLVQELFEELNTIRGIRVGIRISADEYVHSGLSYRDVPELVSRINECPTAYISVSAGVYSRNDQIMPSQAMGEAVYRHLGVAVKSISRVPVMLTGNVNTLRCASSLIADGACDVVLMARALLSDPDLMPKSIRGEEESVTPCTICRLCKYSSRHLPHVVCPHNPALKEMLKTTIKQRCIDGKPVRAVPI